MIYRKKMKRQFERIHNKDGLKAEFAKMIQEKGPYDLWFNTTFRSDKDAWQARKCLKSL